MRCCKHRVQDTDQVCLLHKWDISRLVCTENLSIPWSSPHRKKKSGWRDPSVPLTLVEFHHSGELTLLHLSTVSCAVVDSEGAGRPPCIPSMTEVKDICAQVGLSVSGNPTRALTVVNSDWEGFAERMQRQLS